MRHNHSLRLIMITNDIISAQMADSVGIDYIMIDLELNGKVARQGHLNTHITNHVLEDIPKIKSIAKKSKIIVRINPLNVNSQVEIDQVISLGADYIMLPMFSDSFEVEQFITFVNGKVKTILLLETAAALARLDYILDIKGIDAVYIGLNDLHMSMNLHFMFELLGGGLLDYIIPKINDKGIMCGFGGIARIGEGALPSEYIIREHARLGSGMVILSRTFKDSLLGGSNNQEDKLYQEISLIQEEYTTHLAMDSYAQATNREIIKNITRQLVRQKQRLVT